MKRSYKRVASENLNKEWSETVKYIMQAVLNKTFYNVLTSMKLKGNVQYIQFVYYSHDCDTHYATYFIHRANSEEAIYTCGSNVLIHNR